MAERESAILTYNCLIVGCFLSLLLYTPHFTPQNTLELQTLNSIIILFAGLLMLFGYQLWVLFEGWGLKEPGLRLSDLGRRMGLQRQWRIVVFVKSG